MAETQGYLKPALIGGVVTGVLSVVPLVSMGNCICCLWVIVGAVLSAYMLSEQRQGRIEIADGALVGMLSGLFGAAIVTIVVTLTFPFFGLKALNEQLEQMRRVPGLPPGLEERYNEFLSGRGVILSVLLMVLVTSCFTFAIVGALGGLIGAALFRKQEKPLLPPPPAPPPAP